MSVLRDVLSELFGMFVADARLTAAILVTVAIAAVLMRVLSLPGICGGAFLLLGCVVVLLQSVRRKAAAKK